MSSGRKQQVFRWAPVAVAAAALCAGAGIVALGALATHEVDFPHARILLLGTGASVVFAGALLGFAWRTARRADEAELDRLRTALTLHHIETRNRLVLQNALDAVVSIDKDGAITAWNARAETMFGWSAAQAIGRPLAETIIPERHRHAHRLGLQRYLTTGAPRILGERMNLAALHSSGREFPVEIAITRVRIGSDTSFTAFVRDVTELRQREAQLSESEARFRLLADSAPVQIFITDAEGQVIWLNRRWSDFVGRPIEAGLGRGWVDFVMPEDLQAIMDTAELAVAQKRPYRVQYRLKRHDGRWRWMISEGTAMIGADGTYNGYVGTAFDANDQIEAVQVLRESEARLQRLSADLTQSEARLQLQLERMTLLDRTTREIGAHQGNILDVVMQCLDEHVEVDFACIALHQGGQSLLVVDRIGDKGATLARDAALIPGSTIPIDSESLRSVVSGNTVYDEALTRSTSGPVRLLGNQGLQSLVLAPLRTEQKIYGVLFAGRSVPWGFSSHDREFLRQLSEHVGLAIHQAQLREELQNAYDELRRTQQTLMQQARLRAFGEMASGVAHDINNALSPAALYVESLLNNEPGLSEEARQALETTSRAIASATQTIARMREFYRKRDSQASMRSVDLNAVIKQILLLTRARWKDMTEARGLQIRVVCKLDQGLPSIQGEESELRDALTNLVINAVDAMPAGGTLTVRSIHRESHAVVELADTGIGMDEATRQRCIEPFFTTKGERGTGLGLAMVYGMAERHGAGLQIESTPGEGTLVRLAFPQVAGPVPQAAQQSERAEPLRPLHLLLVDDDSGVLRVLEKLLQREGHRVGAYESATEALEALASARNRGNPFDVVITDLGMPEMDGRRLAALAKDVSPRTPVVLLTGWGQNMPPESESSAIDRVLSKPPSLAELRETLADIVPADSEPDAHRRASDND